MAKPKVKVQKAGDPQKAVEMLQELRNACELEGDLAGAGNYTNAIALIMQGQGAPVEVVAEDDEEAEEEHDALGEPAPDEGEGEAKPDQVEKDDAMMGDDAKAETDPEELDKLLNEEREDEPKEETDGVQTDEQREDVQKPEREAAMEETKKAPSKKASAKKSPVVETISKAEFSNLTGKVDEISKAFAGDIARIVKALGELSEQVDAMQQRPVLHELPAVAIDNQPVQILKGMLKETADPVMREMLGHKIAELEMASVKPNFVGYSR